MAWRLSPRKRWAAFLAGGLLAAGFFFLLFFLMNQPRGWPRHFDAEAAIAAQAPGARATGRTGVVLVALMQPTRFDTPFYDNFVRKLFDVAIPWPINRFAARDTGVALIDPTRPDETSPFTPKVLMSFDGRTTDWDGTPFAEKFARGQVDWVPPSDSVAGDIGSFRYEGRAGGAPGPAQRAMLKARAIYYARLPGGTLPQREQTLAMAEAAFARLRANPALAGTALFDAFHSHDARAALFALLDRGIDTLVVASTLPIHSAFEEYRGAFPKLHGMVQEWAALRGKPAPRLLFAPQFADMPGYADFWARHLAATAPPPPAPGATATLVVSLHGLPVRQTRHDNWVRNSSRATARLVPALAAALQLRGWRVTTVVAQEAFGDTAEDPGDELLSVREAFAVARSRGDALAIAVPVEFLAENTDTLFLHSLLMFDGLPGYVRFQGPPADTDWRRPFVRRFVKGATTHLYVGAPGGDEQDAAGAVLAAGLAPLLPPTAGATP